MNAEGSSTVESGPWAMVVVAAPVDPSRQATSWRGRWEVVESRHGRRGGGGTLWGDPESGKAGKGGVVRYF